MGSLQAVVLSGISALAWVLCRPQFLQDYFAMKLFLFWPWYSQRCFSNFFVVPFSLLRLVSSPIFKMFSQRCHQLCWLAQLWPVVNLLLSRLELAVTGTGQSLTSCHLPWKAEVSVLVCALFTYSIEFQKASPVYKGRDTLFSEILFPFSGFLFCPFLCTSVQ